jgi:hypothetical protein
LLDKAIGGKEKYRALDPTIRDAFKACKAKQLKYTKLKAKNAIIFAAHILDPRCKTSVIADMMPDQRDAIVSMVKKYMITEWPALAEVQIPDLQPVPLPNDLTACQLHIGGPSKFLSFPDVNHWMLKPENSLVWHKAVLDSLNGYVGLPKYSREDDGAYRGLLQNGVWI